MKTLQSDDKIVFKQKALCQQSQAHQKKEAVYVCIEKNCAKVALCQTCVQEKHKGHSVEQIEDIKLRAIKFIESQGKLQQNKEIILLEQVEQTINERFLSMQVALGRALKNFNERIHMYKECIKREQLDILYQIEYACEAIKGGKNINNDQFNKHLSLLNASIIDAGCAAGLVKPAENFLMIKKVDVIRAELQTMSEKLFKYYQNFQETFSKYNEQFNKIFAEGVEEDDQADLKLKLFKNIPSARQSISIHGDVKSKSGNEDSFDLIDSLQFLVNEISDDEDNASAQGANHSSAEAEISNDNRSISSAPRKSLRKQNNRSQRPSIRKVPSSNEKNNILIQIDDDSFAQLEEQENQDNNIGEITCEIPKQDDKEKCVDKVLGIYEQVEQIDDDCPSKAQFNLMQDYSKCYPITKFVIQIVCSQNDQYFVFYKLANGTTSMRGPFENEEGAIKYYEQKIEEQRQSVLKSIC
ncbi:hypothetical protein TTHERM_00526260 (macronuclear) [Tetrahymena thermophila SB210]|uniref:B box-type domain-containing protein n=1 Tax=Tetrahymena thermophila (strain SB210) TaxID=312017 RepID=I7LY67_TETTS|nr:hypothetical protein TTHERM_00526260 [Tetrahymena thermophila SB210]EAS07795.1 hypothetical protein TTHERM_00526260 [Tetrahymena thermophila SB210]|eukprot:XP_001028037.1 hypothetical protein TTHERM_00526260 [Tetrahymena thermophila SB210]